MSGWYCALSIYENKLYAVRCVDLQETSRDIFQEAISVSQKKGVSKLRRNKNRLTVVKNTTLRK